MPPLADPAEAGAGPCPGFIRLHRHLLASEPVGDAPSRGARACPDRCNHTLVLRSLRDLLSKQLSPESADRPLTEGNKGREETWKGTPNLPVRVVASTGGQG